MAGAVLAGHAALLGLWPKSPGPHGRAEAQRAIQVRSIVLTPPAQLPPARPSAPRAAAPAERPVARDIQPPDEPRVATAAAAPAAVQAVEPTPAPGGMEAPVYATRMPPPATLRFEMRRGAASGQAELQWRPREGGYELSLRGLAPGAPLLGWASQGGFDDAGLAPERYTESRRGRELRAANFQRGAGRITFSGPAVEYPLLGGAQDRLSWIVQLAAVLAANPALVQPGAQVSMFVVGTRGDGEVWRFNVSAPETLSLPSGEAVAVVPLRREPVRPYDTGAQVWLDPARHYLPVRLRLAVRATGEGVELQLTDSRGP